MADHPVRIHFKTDAESSIGCGCIIYPGHLREEVVRMVRVATLTAPPLRDGIMIISEGYRDVRGSRDLHEELRAWDIPGSTVLHAGDFDSLRTRLESWSRRIGDRSQSNHTDRWVPPDSGSSSAMGLDIRHQRT